MNPTLAIEDQVHCLLNRFKLDKSHKQFLQNHLKSENFNWNRLFELIKINQTIPLSTKRLVQFSSAKNKIPEEFLIKTQNIQQLNQNRSRNAMQLFEALSAAEIEVIVLKGFQFAKTIYNDIGYKKMNDVDILVQPKDVEKTLNILESLQYSSFGSFPGMSSKVTESTHHTPAYLSADQTCMVGIHWDICSPKRKIKPNIIKLWKNKIPYQMGRAQLYHFRPEDNFFHIAIHLPPYKTGVRELADASNCVLAAGKNFSWQYLWKHTQEANAYDAVYRTLKFAELIGNFTAPQNFQKKLDNRVSLQTKLDIKLRFLNPYEIFTQRSVIVGKIEKTFIHFLKSKNKIERIQVWKKMMNLWLNPGIKESLKIVPLHSAPKLAQVMSPLALWSVMGQDYGFANLTAVTAYHISEVSKELLGLKNKANGPKFSDSTEFNVLENLE